MALYHQFLFMLLAAGAAFLLTPMVRKFALRIGAVDAPSARKPHDAAIPTMGGVAMFVAFVGVVIAAYMSHSLWAEGQLFSQLKMRALVCGSTIMLALGILDDKFGVNYKIKLLAQLSVAVLMFSAGYRIDGITNPLTGIPATVGYWSLPITIAWFLFVINAINIMDGIDGLAAGIALIALTTMFFVARYWTNYDLAFLALVAAGSVAGFLRYNFYPASIFMGDSGSLFLGFLLAALSIGGAQKSSTAVALAVPIVILGLPLLDVVAAVIRRWSTEWKVSNSFRSRAMSFKNVFRPDLNHIHHRFVAHGLSKPKAVILLYVIAIGFGFAGFVLAAAVSEMVAWMLIYMAIVFFIVFHKFSVFREALNPERWQENEDADLTPSFDTLIAAQATAKKTIRFSRVLIWSMVIALPIIISASFIVKYILF